jgi:hypothetical protein
MLQCIAYIYILFTEEVSLVWFVDVKFLGQKSSIAGHIVCICNPCYSGGGDPEDHGLRSAWRKSLWDSISVN